MSASPAPGSSSKSPTPTALSSNFNIIFEKALKEYNTKTRQRLTAHPLATEFDKCDSSPSAILSILQDQVDQFNQSRSKDERLQRWLSPTINVLLAFTETLGEGISLAFPPAKVIFVGAGVLLQAAKDVEASEEILIDVFERIENFFRRLEVYTSVPPTPAMTDMMVKIIVEVLDILGTATKEMKQSRAKKFLKKIAGITKLEDGLKKLDKMTNEEARMASAESLRLCQTIDKKVVVVDERVQGVGRQVKDADERVQDLSGKVKDVDEKVEDVDAKVQGVDEKVQGVGEQVRGVEGDVKVVRDNVQMVIDDGKKKAEVIQKVAYDIDDMKRSQLRASLRQWQSPSDPSMNQNFASGRQHEGTAEWFCGGGNFDKWKVSGSLLWIHGKPGSGKSILCSAIINDIEFLQKAGLASMAYFYFDFRDERKQSHGDLLRSLLIQLSALSDPFCDLLSRLYEESGKGTRQPSDRALMYCLKEMLTLPNQCPVYLIFDALDECPNTSGIPTAREQVLNLVKELVGLHLSSLHICVTSRPEVNIRYALEGLASCLVSLQDESGQKEDIANYIKSVVHSPSDTHMKRWKEEDKDLVVKTLSERADGMFRWVYCQLDTLRQCLPQNVQFILSQLPVTLDETYARVLHEIGKTNEFYALRLLQCLTVAKRPLYVEELAEILALDFGTEGGLPELKENWRSKDQQDAVLSMCSSLIVVVPDTVRDDSRHVVQFSHFSVKEFLTSDRLATPSLDIPHLHILPEPAHTVVAKACLGILLQVEDANSDLEKHSPLAIYAAQYWMDHARFEKVWTHVEDGIRRLFDPAKPYLKSWLIYSGLHRSRFFSGYNLLTHCGSPLYYASLCGFRDLAAHFISENPQHVTGPFGRNPTPLVAALHRGHLDVADLLYQAGADLGIRNDDNRNLLHAVSEEGSVDVAKWLFNHGVPGILQEDSDKTPLHLTEVNRRQGHGITVNGVDNSQNTPLHLASECAHFEIMRELLRRGADVNAQDRRLQTPLHRASDEWSNGDRNYTGKSETMAEAVQLLVDRGANVTAQDITHLTPLHVASLFRVSEAMRILIEHGADVNAQNETNLTPLHNASLVGDPETVQLLIKHGADVTARDWNHYTPLHFASSWGREKNWVNELKQRNPNADAVRILIEHGADVTAQDKTRSTPLHMASSMGLAEGVRLLIEHGADVTAQNEDHLTPLHLASTWKYSDFGALYPNRCVSKVETVRLLIENGADVTMQDDTNSTPLHLASAKGIVEIVQLLLQHGADIAAQDGSQRTPLHLALSWDDKYFSGEPDAKSNAMTETVRLLIKHGASVTAQDKTHSTPLHLAAFCGSSESVRLLLEHGAGVCVLDECHKTPLHLASSPFSDRYEISPAISRAKIEIVRLLIEQGVDVTAKDKNLSTPLHLASSLGIPEIVQLLIERGADITANDAKRRTPLHIATSYDDCFQMPPSQESNPKADIVKLLIDHGADVAAQDETQLTPLHHAAFWGNAETVRLLIQRGADVAVKDSSNMTPLHSASSTYDSNTMQHTLMSFINKAETMRLLIELGADVTAQDDTHSTPLHVASRSGIPDLVQLLVEHGADANRQDLSRRTPLHLASSCEVWYADMLHNVDADTIEDTMRLLIDHGANVAAQDETHSTPLHLAALGGNTRAVLLLIEQGADVAARDGNHRTPLHLASSRRDEGPQKRFYASKDSSQAHTMLILISHGADVTALDDTHSTPLHLASSKGSAETVGLLIQHGADVNAQNKDLSTPLHLAASSRLALEGTIVRLLLRHGANIDSTDSEGRTPLDIASSAGNSWIAKVLSDHRARRG